MNIRDFEYIIAVDELKSFIKASKKCFVSQPALSMQIQKTEDVLGVKIFERTRKNIITTPEGQNIINYAKEIIKNFEKIKTLKHSSSIVRIGFIQTIFPYLLPKISNKIEESSENTKFFFSESKTQDLIQNLIKGELDAAIIASSQMCKNIPGLSILNDIKLYEESFFLALPENYKINFPNSLNSSNLVEVLNSEKLILLEDGNCLNDDLQEICNHYKVNSKQISNLSTNNIEAVKEMIKLGSGVSILPLLSLSGKETSGLRFLKMPAEEFRTIFLVYRKNSSKAEILTQVAKIITNTVANLG